MPNTRPSLLRFAAALELELKRHDVERGRAGWRDARHDTLFNMLTRHYCGLSEAIETGNSEKVKARTIDIANLCMMLHANH